MPLKTEQIRNILFLGHRGSGKTSLVEALVAKAKKSKKGSVEGKNTISDFRPEEKDKLTSSNLAVVSFDYNGHRLNLVDVPGNDDFVYEADGALNAIDGAILVVDAQSGVEMGTIKHFIKLNEANIPTFIYINKMDKEEIRFDELIEELEQKLGSDLVNFVVPLGKDKDFDGYINIVTKKARRYENGKAIDDVVYESKKEAVLRAHGTLVEKVALTDDALLEKFFAEEEITLEEIHKGLHQTVVSGEVKPILVGSALKDIGMEILLDMIIEYLPNPAEVAPYEIDQDGGETSVRRADVEDAFSAFSFKTYYDQYKGNLSIIKIASGSLKVGDEVYCPNLSETFRINNLANVYGETLIPIKEAVAGDIVAISKLDGFETAFTLCDRNNQVTYPRPNFPTPVYYQAMEVKSASDEAKLSSTLQKLQLEDPVLDLVRNAETKQYLIGGLSDSHINFHLDKVKSLVNVNTTLVEPKVSYRETLQGKAEADGRYIKQSGGSGFYGVVSMRFEPSGSEENIFTEEIFGGSVPRNYWPAVEKGFYESCEEGRLVGFPVIGVKATLFDGKDHSVDSNEMAFKMAAKLAFNAAYENANPTILEPIMKVTVHVFNEFMGNVMTSLTQRRGRIQSTDEKPGNISEIVALVPESEIIDYAIQLRLLSQSSGVFSREFDSYQKVPNNLIDDIIKKHKPKDK